MKKIILFLSFSLFVLTSNAQQAAMQFSGLDCNNNSVDLFADLNAGKAVVVFFYMPNCGSCPPPASKIQTMANNVMNTYPGMVKGYAYPFQNSTTCSYSSSWVTNNNLPFYAPMDSGAAQVAYYGGFGMPTVVLLGGTDHRVLFATQSFSTSDTTIMRDSILNLLSPSGINSLNNVANNISLFPSPANQEMNVSFQMTQPAEMKLEVVNMLGESVDVLFDEKSASGTIQIKVPTGIYSNGVYFIRLSSGNKTANYKFTVTH
jgi:hypothetical protein